MEKSRDALKILIKGETEAVAMYASFALKAEIEGWYNTAALFTALSEAESIHIKNHLQSLGEDFTPDTQKTEVGSTLENLNAAIEGESEESRRLYPRLIRSIKSELSGEYGKVARLSMTWARKVEKEHARLLKKARKAIKNGRDLPVDKIYLCKVCGNIVFDDPGEVCDVCGHDTQFFKQIKGDE
ncbi:rubrerythrin family protein [Spirochaeta isovalerica]|uniref:Rubrerythrin n=1 Tax=Spirochaeta isovalerica TaxID=150 RepID=A0A841R8L4_9SPIO|nr:rubrerythrin family protein [Spirochaeta isovalerica]MBB6479299.1 rubrerythrin [Spirochaeta isovalerica]